MSAAPAQPASTARRRFVVANGVGHGANALFHVLAIRALDGGEYASFAALSAIMLAVSVPINALLVPAVKASALERSVSARRATLLATAPAVVAGGLLALVSNPVADLVGIEDPAAVMLLGLFFVPVTAAVPPRGLLLARSELDGLSAGVGLAAVARVGLGLGLLTFGGGGLVAAMVATVVAESVHLVIVSVLALRVAGGAEVRLAGHGVLRALGALVGFWVMAGVDVVAARRLLSTMEAGDFAVVAAAAAAIHLGPQAFALAALPGFARSDRPTAAGLLRAGTSTVLLATLLAVGLLVTGPWLLPIVLDVDRPDLLVLGTLSVAGVFRALAYFLVSADAAGRAGRWPAGWVGLVTAVAVLALVDATPAVIASAALIAAIATCAVALLGSTAPQPQERVS